MKDKIAFEIYKKLCEGFNSEFFTVSQFANEYEKYYLPLTSEITILINNYKKNSIIKSFEEFVKENKKEYFAVDELKKTLSFEKLFINYFAEDFYIEKLEKSNLNDAIVHTFEKFKKQYLEKEIIKIYEKALNQINDIEFSGFELCAINVGKRTYESGNSGWIINNFEVNNNKKVYKFSNSTKDESRLTGMFINLFLLQLNKKHLLKISITLKETEQTTFIIWKDFEKISLKNECEVYISKHHGNESIIFDSKKEAIQFLEKVIEIKEGKNNNFHNNKI